MDADARRERVRRDILAGQRASLRIDLDQAERGGGRAQRCGEADGSGSRADVENKPARLRRGRRREEDSVGSGPVAARHLAQTQASTEKGGGLRPFLSSVRGNVHLRETFIALKNVTASRIEQALDRVLASNRLPFFWKWPERIGSCDWSCDWSPVAWSSRRKCDEIDERHDPYSRRRGDLVGICRNRRAGARARAIGRFVLRPALARTQRHLCARRALLQNHARALGFRRGLLSALWPAGRRRRPAGSPAPDLGAPEWMLNSHAE